MNDITNRRDIHLLVDLFYTKVLKDELIGGFFTHLNFKDHLPKMIEFWSFVLLDQPGYQTNVVGKHLQMKIEQQHMDRWIALFKATLEENFEGEKANTALQRAEWIAWTILHKIHEKS